MPYIFLSGAFLCNAIANVLLKLAAMNGFTFGGFFKGQFGISTVFAGVAAGLFALNLALYLVALERIPLSTGYPIMIGMTFFITIGASIFLGEKINIIHALGMALILGGIFLIVKFAS